jgi:thiamine pyrophosphokinase
LNALIFANGELNAPANWQKLVASSDLIVAADGGADHCSALGLVPDVLIGDLDSLNPGAIEQLTQAGVKLIQHPEQKDQTDFELALLHAKAQQAKTATVLGGLGRRWDHSLANLLLTAQPQFADLKVVFLDGMQRLYPLRGKTQLDAKVGERVSLLPLGGDAKGVSTKGLKYQLEEESLFFGSSRGVSNMATDDLPTVTVQEGVLLCIVSPIDLE